MTAGEVDPLPRAFSRSAGRRARRHRWALGASDRVSLALAWPDGHGGELSGEAIRLGGALSAEVPQAFYGPSLNSLTSGSGTSRIRWHVANDWRRWTTSTLASLQTESRFRPLRADRPLEAEDTRIRRLSSMIAQDDAHLNIRLLVQLESGRHLFF